VFLQRGSGSARVPVRVLCEEESGLILGGWFGLGGCVWGGVAMVVSFCMAWASVLLGDWGVVVLGILGWAWSGGGGIVGSFEVLSVCGDF